MSSLTKEQFREEEKGRSSIITTIATEKGDSHVDGWIDIALRKYSDRCPKILVSADNAITDEGLYNIPANALEVKQVRDSSSHLSISFYVEDDGTGNKIRLGNIQKKSTDYLNEDSYYQDPLVSASPSGVDFSNFDIIYSKLQTMSSIGEMGLEALHHYLEYLSYSFKASGSAVNADVNSESGQVPISTTDSDSSGSSTTVAYDSQKNVSQNYQKLAQDAMNNFMAITSVPYGTRG